jgi:hypothetical protein
MDSVDRPRHAALTKHRVCNVGEPDEAGSERD